MHGVNINLFSNLVLSNNDILIVHNVPVKLDFIVPLFAHKLHKHLQKFVASAIICQKTIFCKLLGSILTFVFIFDIMYLYDRLYTAQL